MNTLDARTWSLSRAPHAAGTYADTATAGTYATGNDAAGTSTGGTGAATALTHGTVLPAGSALVGPAVDMPIVFRDDATGLPPRGAPV